MVNDRLGDRKVGEVQAKFFQAAHSGDIRSKRENVLRSIGSDRSHLSAEEEPLALDQREPYEFVCQAGWIEGRQPDWRLLNLEGPIEVSSLKFGKANFLQGASNLQNSPRSVDDQ